jgi:hypothetical protein
VDLSVPLPPDAHPVRRAIHAVAETTLAGTLYYPGEAIDEVERRLLVPKDHDERLAFMDRLWADLHPTFTSDFTRRGRAPRTLAEARRWLGRRLDVPIFLVWVRRLEDDPG